MLSTWQYKAMIFVAGNPCKNDMWCLGRGWMADAELTLPTMYNVASWCDEAWLAERLTAGLKSEYLPIAIISSRRDRCSPSRSHSPSNQASIMSRIFPLRGFKTSALKFTPNSMSAPGRSVGACVRGSLKSSHYLHRHSKTTTHAKSWRRGDTKRLGGLFPVSRLSSSEIGMRFPPTQLCCGT